MKPNVLLIKKKKNKDSLYLKLIFAKLILSFSNDIIVDGHNQNNNSAQQNSNPLRKNTPGRRKKPCLSSRERNVRRIESNERERLRMHGLNIAFQVRFVFL